MHEIIIYRTDGLPAVVIYVNEEQLDYELQLLEHAPDVADYNVISL